MTPKVTPNENQPTIAAPSGPTMNATACAAPATPNAVPRRARVTFAAINAFVAGTMADCTSEISAYPPMKTSAD